MPSPSLATSALHHRVIPSPLTPLSLLDTALDEIVHHTRQRTRRPDVPVTHPRTPERARRTPRARQDVTSPRRSTPPLASAARQHLRQATSNRQDKPTWPRERCGSRHRRRDPPRHRQLPSSSRPRQCIVFTVIRRSVTALTSPTHARHRQCISAPVDASSTMTSSPPHGLASQL